MIHKSLQECGYKIPDSPDQVSLAIVTVTRHRRDDLREQSIRLSKQIGHRDHWIVVRDCDEHNDGEEIGCFLPPHKTLEVSLEYERRLDGSVNMARHAGCSMAFRNQWIIEVDDHDWIEPGCLDAVRQAICQGAGFIYGDCLYFDEAGNQTDTYIKADYSPYLLRDGGCPCEGVRAFPKLAYELVGGYRWHGERNTVGGNEFPGGDYGLFMRIEQLYEGTGFVRVPKTLCRCVKGPSGITGKYYDEQASMAEKLRTEAGAGRLASWPKING